MSQRVGFRFKFFHCKIRGPKFVTTGMLLFKFFSHKNQGDLNFYNNHRRSLIISNQPQTLLGFQIFSPRSGHPRLATRLSRKLSNRYCHSFFPQGGGRLSLRTTPSHMRFQKHLKKGDLLSALTQRKSGGKQKGREPRKPCFIHFFLKYFHF